MDNKKLIVKKDWEKPLLQELSITNTNNTAGDSDDGPEFGGWS